MRRKRSDRLRCPFCHDAIGPLPHATRCPDCLAQVHVACAKEWSDCATLGCETWFLTVPHGRVVAVGGERSRRQGEWIDQLHWLLISLAASLPVALIFWTVFESSFLRWVSFAASAAAAWLLLGFVRRADVPPVRAGPSEQDGARR